MSEPRDELVGNYWRTLGQKVVHVIRSSVFAGWCFWKLGFCPPKETGRGGTALMITFQKDGTQVLGNDIPALYNGLGRKITSQSAEQNCTMASFLT